MIEVMVFVFGMCVGSFMNVCIYRLPDPDQSIVRPRSRCPGCKTLIPFYDNIPVMSYLLLRGRCRHCHTTISLRYPLVEVIGGLFALCVFLRFGLTLEGLLYYAFICCLLVITFVDIDLQIIPDLITLPGIPIFFIAAIALTDISWIDSLLGFLVGGGSLFAIGWGYQLLTRKEGMGGGDIKLLAMIGVLLGWQGTLFTIFIASAAGTLAGIAVMLQQRRNMKLAIPFGPFLSIGAIVYLFFGPPMISWYLNVMR